MLLRSQSTGENVFDNIIKGVNENILTVGNEPFDPKLSEEVIPIIVLKAKIVRRNICFFFKYSLLIKNQPFNLHCDCALEFDLFF